MQDSKQLYNLCQQYSNSNLYYQEIEKVAEEIKQELLSQFKYEISMFQSFIKEQNLEKVRTTIEYGLELLMLGVFWRSYETETKNQTLKQLISWLNETGEYGEEVIRLEQWQLFLQKQTVIGQAAFKRKVMALADYLNEKAEKTLNEYVKGVELFRKEGASIYENREDQVFCMQPTIMYYLNMVGAQLLNEVYRQDFLKAEQKVIFLPGCMVYRGKEECKALFKQGGYECEGCTTQCQVNQIKKLALKRKNVKTIVLYHESELNKQKVNKEQEGKLGVIGVACVLSLLSGGFKAKRLGYVPQCVLLDYCGCKQHWSKEGIVTQLNLLKLQMILNEA